MNKTENYKKKQIKTSITIDEKLWKEFSILVIQNEGIRKKNEVINQLIKQYIRINKGDKKIE